MARIQWGWVAALALGAAVGTAQAQPRVADLNLQRGFDAPLAPVPSVFSSSVASPHYEQGPESPASLSKYIAATLALERGVSPGQPINEADIEHDEGAFLHTADPASLTVVRRVSLGIEAHWAHDDRDGTLAPQAYRVYRNTGAGMQLAASLAPNASAKYNSFIDGSAFGAAQAVCYEIRTLDQAGTERSYSQVQCAQSPQATFVKHLEVSVQSKTCPLPSEMPAKCGDPVAARTECFCDVSYSIQAEIEGGVNQAEFEVWGYTPGPLTDPIAQCGEWVKWFPNHCLLPFGRRSSQYLSGNGTLYTGTLTRKEPIIYMYWSRQDGRTESPLVRLRVVDGGGGVEHFPRVGYLSQQRNNRLRDRLWSGINTNPASATWARSVAATAVSLRAQGFNGIFLDEYRPLKADVQVANGINHEGPAIEYPYAAGATNDPNFVDPWSTGLAGFAQALRYWDGQLRPAGSAPTQWAGNAIHAHDLSTSVSRVLAREELRATTGLDQVMFEACIVSGEESLSGDAWERHLKRIDEVTASGRRLNCHITPANGQNELLADTSGLAPRVRLFSLASFLMANDQHLATLGQWEINPTVVPPTFPGKLINDFVEFRTDLGTPTELRRRVSNDQCWQRAYSNGVALVNANASGNCTFVLPRAMHPLRLVRPSQRPDNPYDPGDAELGPATSMVTLPPRHGALALNPGVPAPAYPRRYYASTRFPDFNRDRYSDLYLYNPDSGWGEMRHGRRADGLAAGFGDAQNQHQSWTLGNFNGDAYTDLFGFAPSGHNNLRYAYPGGFVDHYNGQWSAGHSFVPGDFNGDGYEDLLLYGPQGQVEVRYGHAGKGLQFSQASQTTWSTGFTLVPGDFNGDGRTDVLLYGSGGHTEIRYGHAGEGLRFAPASQTTWSLGQRLVPGDFNGDSYTDLLLYGAAGTVEIRYGQSGDGLRFAPASQTQWSTGYALVPGDFNSDGYADVFLYGADGSTEIRYGWNADGLAFSPQSQQQWGTGLKAISGDFNGDYFSDLAVYDPVTGMGEIRYGQASPGLRASSVPAESWGIGYRLISGSWKQY